MNPWPRLACACFVTAALLADTARAAAASTGRPAWRPAGRVRLNGYAVADDRGPFLGLGVSYFTALHRCKYDRPRVESDLAYLASQGFRYFRMLSMVGWNPAWDGLEIAPVRFTSRAGKTVEAWPDYWQQLRALVDLAFDRYGLRTQITIFADAQLMPDKAARRAHAQRILTDVVAGREQKIMLLEVANEAWQNGFPGDEGVSELRELAALLARGTEVPVAITSNHEGSFERVYAGSAADIATWHFSRDLGPDGGWKPVYDCWEYAVRPGCPPVSSNEPIGPGSSVASERDPVRLAMAAAFAWAAKAPLYVFHSEAGVFGKSRFEEMPGIGAYRALLRLLPPDLPNWERNDGKEESAPFTAYAGGEANRYAPEVPGAADGCVRNTGSRKGRRFLCLPIGIRPEGLRLKARQHVRVRVHHPVTGETVLRAERRAGEMLTLPQGPGAYVVLGETLGR